MEFATTLSTTVSSSAHKLAVLPLAIAILIPLVIAGLVFLARRRTSEEHVPPKKKHR